MAIVINNGSKREELAQLKQLQTEIDTLLQDPNLDPATKQQVLADLSLTQSTIQADNMTNRDARQYTLSVYKGILEKLAGNQGYSESMVGGATRNIFGTYSRAEKEWMANETLKRSAQHATGGSRTVVYDPIAASPKTIHIFDPAGIDEEYRIAGTKKDKATSIKAFASYLTNVLQQAKTVLSDSNNSYQGWDKTNSSKIDGWINTLSTVGTGSDEELNTQILSMGKMVNALKNSNIQDVFEGYFGTWLEGFSEPEASRQEGTGLGSSGTVPAEYQKYPTLISKGLYYFKDQDGKYRAYKDSEGTQYADQSGYVNTDFTSDTYGQGWLIGPNGEIVLANFADVESMRPYMSWSGYTSAIDNARTEVGSRYENPFSYKSAFEQSPFGASVNHNNHTFVDLSYYFPGEGIVLGVKKDSDTDNFLGYNWSESDRIFYVSKDGQNWQAVQGIDNVYTTLETGDGRFNYQGADRHADPKQDRIEQFDKSNLVNVPDGWYTVHSFSGFGDNYESWGYASKQQFIKDMVDLVIPGNYEKAASRLGIEKTDKLLNNMKRYKGDDDYKGFYKSLFLEARKLGMPWSVLGALIIRFNFPDMELTISEQEAKEYLSQFGAKYAKGGVLKLSDGGTPWYMQYVNATPSTSSSAPVSDAPEEKGDMTALYERAQASNRSLVGQAKGESEGSMVMDGAMGFRLGALVTDIAGLISSFIPGYGTAAAGVAGLTSLGLDMTADIMDESVSKGQVALNAALNLGMGIVGLIPGGKAWKITKSLLVYAPALANLGILTPDIISKLGRVKDGSYSLTYDDWKNIYAALSTVTGLSSNAATATKLKRLKGNAPESSGKSTVKSKGDGKEYTFTDDELALIHREGERHGQGAAVAKTKEILLKKYPKSKKEIESIDLGFDYGSKRDVKTGLGNWVRKKFRNDVTIESQTTKVPADNNDPMSLFFKDDPWRKGNPYNPKDWETHRTSDKWFRLSSDYQLAHRGAKSPIDINVDWEWLKALKAFGQDLTKGANYQKRHNRIVSLDVDGKKYVTNIPKDNDIFVVKDADGNDQIIQISPTDNGKWQRVGGKEIYVKEGDTYKKVADQPDTKSTSTKKTTQKTQETKPEKQVIDTPTKQATTVKIVQKKKNLHKFKADATRAAETHNAKTMNARQVNRLLKAKGMEQDAKEGGYMLDGVLHYYEDGGKLCRLNQYINK